MLDYIPNVIKKLARNFNEFGVVESRIRRKSSVSKLNQPVGVILTTGNGAHVLVQREVTKKHQAIKKIILYRLWKWP